MLLLPGLDGTGRLFYRQTPGLARSFRVATCALRDGATSMDQLVADAVHAIDLLAPDARRAMVVGESFGGALALSLALARPDRVSGLVILNSCAHFAQFRLRLAIAGLRALPWGAMGAARRLAALRLHSRQTPRDEVRRFLEITARATRDGYLSRLRLLRRYDVRGRLHELRCPTLFLAASKDHLVPAVAQARFMAARVPGATVRILEGHGHICLIAPDVDLDRIIREWRG